jgi:hypothetical protein
MIPEDRTQPEAADTTSGEATAPPAVGHVLRQSLVYGLAGMLVAYDKSNATVHKVVQGVRHGMRRVTPATDSEADAAPPSEQAGVS